MKKLKNKNSNGITLIALIITIIVMLILVGVTITVALNGGLFKSAKNASRETEMNAIYEIIVSASRYDSNGDINVDETYNAAKQTLNSNGYQEVSDLAADGSFTVTGKNGQNKYKYKITKSNITIENETKDTLAELKEKTIGKGALDILNGGIEGIQIESASEKLIVSYKDEIFELVYDTTTYIITDVVRSNWRAFADEGNYYEIYKNGNGIVITGLTDYGKSEIKKDKKLVIPATIKATDGETYSVLEVQNDSFSKDTEVKNSIESVEFGEGIAIDEIEKQTFYEFPNLAGTIKIPANVKKIGEGAFYKTKLNSLLFEDNSLLETIGSNAFMYTDISNSIVIPARVKKIETNAFNQSKITELQFQEESNIENIEGFAFSTSTLTGNIDIPETCLEIGQYAFYNTNITGLKFNGKIILNEGCFTDCKNLTGQIYIYDETQFNSGRIFNNINIEKLSMPINFIKNYYGNPFNIYTYSEQFVLEIRGTTKEHWDNMIGYYDVRGLTNDGEIKQNYSYTVITQDGTYTDDEFAKTKYTN